MRDMAPEMNIKDVSCALGEKDNDSVHICDTARVISQSPEFFITEDNIINTQGSTELDSDEPMKMTGLSTIAPNNSTSELGQEKLEIPPEDERRRSDRLKKTTTMSTSEKTKMVTQKRNLEGLFLGVDKEALEAGVNTMLAIAVSLTSKKKMKRGPPQLKDGQDDDQQD
ncbi:uncharacterized protein [Miscanthus floridulus]|uniref:uncharacterized protein n=1 Tax=Miscanthus floridulus TaxID=154761 RepID=UPI0034598045